MEPKDGAVDGWARSAAILRLLGLMERMLADLARATGLPESVLRERYRIGGSQ